jgi:hypothetical protein
MANRYEGERGGRWQRDERDEFRNRGRSEWDDDFGNGSGHGRAYGRARFDEDNDQGRMSAQGYYDDRYNEQAGASRSGRYDQDWSDRDAQSASRFDQGDYGGWRGRGGYTEGGWRGQRGYRQGGYGSNGYSAGFGGGSMGYGANRDYRRDRGYAEGNYGGANLRAGRNQTYDEGSYGSNEPYGQGSYRQGGAMRGQTGFGVPGSTGQGDYGPYSTDWAQSGRMGGPMTHHDEDYHHWRSQQIGKLDKDYEAWRNERRQKFSDEFEKWRSARPQNGDDENPSTGQRSGSAATTQSATGSGQSGSSRNK